jgi:hypothetical protein
MVAIPDLVLVANARDIAGSHHAFVRDIARFAPLAIDLFRRTHYWVYEPTTATFSPSKFTGYAGMDLARYNAARHRSSGVKFDGGITQRAIAHVVGAYAPDPDLAHELEQWSASLFGRDILRGIDRAKWAFVRIPVGVSGLAALAGGWEGSDDLVEHLLAVRRTPGRVVPDLDAAEAPGPR